ncbi:hypothetical protein AF72_08905 [Xylella taiwanensis]|uniref:Uncharacterized protein n=1 Tax=Xylella taiwanensis TaxID=1444770 RepID=Z9JIY1_9GAMM|nr:hypothetical protein AB672_06710 [Xylella taiwanensis]EWS77791.1 hypothetical protein AF72_08905 [Xylella taiwanensis]
MNNVIRRCAGGVTNMHEMLLHPPVIWQVILIALRDNPSMGMCVAGNTAFQWLFLILRIVASDQSMIHSFDQYP